MKKPVSKAMKICGDNVRELSCRECQHYEKCVNNGNFPISILGSYLAWLKLTALPKIEKKYNPITLKGMKLQAVIPSEEEMERGAFVSINIKTLTQPVMRLSRLLIINMKYDLDELDEKIIKAYYTGFSKRYKKWNACQN